MSQKPSEPIEGASASLSASQSRPLRQRGSLIRPRPRVGIVHVTALALLFASVGGALATADASLDAAWLAAGERSPVTIRVAPFAGFRGERTAVSAGGVVLERGETASVQSAAVAREVLMARPGGVLGWATVSIALFIFAVFFSLALRASHKGKLVRHQVVVLLLLLGSMALIKAATVFTAVSILAMPVALFTLLARSAMDRQSATATGLFAAFAVGSLVPFDPGVITVLAAQAVAPALVLGRAEVTKRGLILGGLAGGAAAVAAYVAYWLLDSGSLPPLEMDNLHRSGVGAAVVGGLVSGPLAILLLPPVQVSLGEVTANRLVELEDFSNPLLQQIAERSPGTWQHSLAMANMAETAANAVGANGRLVRTGAYYHDLGKSLQPKYFIENLTSGEPSPHDSLAPEVSADVIFAHVTEGVRVGRQSGLPERIIDFMHMHHGDGRLEYFWSKCRELGNPGGLTEDAFRYPGLRPQSKETAVLAIVDAVEAASRTLRNPDERSTRNLVQRIVYGKLHLGQLDESGLTMSDLRKISEALVTTIKHAHHGRIEYPWQREEAASGSGTVDSTEQPTRHIGRPQVAPAAPESGRSDIRLDSLDAPRPGWGSERAASSASSARRLPAALVVESPATSTDADAASVEEADTGDEPITIGAGDSAILLERPLREGVDNVDHVDSLSGANKMASPFDEDDPKTAPIRGATSGGDGELTEPRTNAIAPERTRQSRATDRLSEWEDALEMALPATPRRARETLGLLKSGDAESVLEPPTDADFGEPTALSPGTLVVGPPPQTQPRETKRGQALGPQDEHATLEVRLPVPPESVRPSKRKTTEHPVVVPKEAFPDDTEPSALAALKKKK